MDRMWSIEDQVSILEAVMNQSEQILASSTVAAPPIFTNTVGISNQQPDGQGTRELDLSLFQRFASNRRVNEAAFISLIAAYSILIVIGTIGNSLVVYVVARQPAMRTARNVFVVNLAVSDLLLCLITMPLTLMEILSNTWPLGNSPVSCKMVGSLQAVSIFVSTLSITAIALDRYQLIVYPTKRSFQLTGALLALAGIWVTGVVLALPLFIVRTLQHFEMPEGIRSQAAGIIHSIDYCLEDWTSEKGRSYYSAGSILVQYALPIITVTIAHARICNKLQVRMTNMQQRQQQSTVTTVVQNNQNNVKVENDTRKTAREEQLRKTNVLLMMIAIIFTICWLPMNIFNVVVDTWNVFGDDTETMLIVYAVCHMVGMSSACSNPLLYGWLNDNFRKEFQKIGASFQRKNNNNAAIQSRVDAAKSSTAGRTVRHAIIQETTNNEEGVNGGHATQLVVQETNTKPDRELQTEMTAVVVTHNAPPDSVADVMIQMQDDS